MTVTNHLLGPQVPGVAPGASVAVAAIAFALIGLIIGLVIIGIDAGADLPAMEDLLTSATTPPTFEAPTS